MGVFFVCVCVCFFFFFNNSWSRVLALGFCVLLLYLSIYFYIFRREPIGFSV